MALNKKFYIAIEALTYIALNSGQKPVSSKDICSKFGLKLRYTEQIMQNMVKKGILKSSRGASGGYSLARERRRIDLNEVYAITCGLVKGANALSEENNFSPIIKELNMQIEAELSATLSKITLEDIYNRAVKIEGLYGKNAKTDFSI